MLVGIRSAWKNKISDHLDWVSAKWGLISRAAEKLHFWILQVIVARVPFAQTWGLLSKERRSFSAALASTHSRIPGMICLVVVSPNMCSYLCRCFTGFSLKPLHISCASHSYLNCDLYLLSFFWQHFQYSLFCSAIFAEVKHIQLFAWCQ